MVPLDTLSIKARKVRIRSPLKANLQAAMQWKASCTLPAAIVYAEPWLLSQSAGTIFSSAAWGASN